MNCDTFVALLPQYPDDMPDEATKQAFLQHAAACEDCAALLAEQEDMLASLHALDDGLDVPSAFTMGWRDAIAAETTPARQKTPWYARWQSWTAAAAAVVMLFAGTSLMRNGLIFPTTTENSESPATTQRKTEVLTPFMAPAEGDYDDGYAYDVAMDEESMVLGSDAAPAGGMADEADVSQGRILLRSASISLETDQFDAAMERIENLMDDLGGWVEYKSVYGEPLADNPEAGRNAYLNLRIPDEALDAFVGETGTIGKVMQSSTTSEDISTSYYDTQGRLGMYTAQRDRLTELLADAQSMADIIEIESRLQEVQHSIESLTNRLGRWDSEAANAAVSISVAEVPTQGSHARAPLPQRLADAFTNSLRSARAFLGDMLVFIVLIAPYVLIASAVFGVLYIIYRIHKRQK